MRTKPKWKVTTTAQWSCTNLRSSYFPPRRRTLFWAYHFQGKLDEAIAECKRAIEIDPEFGNPYNDIGAYLIELGRFEEAIPWLERATEARRYEPRHFPHYNLGRAYLGKEMYGQAMRCFQDALEVEPRYSAARQALESLRRMVN
jgi:tetratricopeptide (TPR) repeat protein